MPETKYMTRVPLVLSPLLLFAARAADQSGPEKSPKTDTPEKANGKQPYEYIVASGKIIGEWGKDGHEKLAKLAEKADEAGIYQLSETSERSQHQLAALPVSGVEPEAISCVGATEELMAANRILCIEMVASFRAEKTVDFRTSRPGIVGTCIASLLIGYGDDLPS